MKRSNRILVAYGAGVALLVLISVILLFTLNRGDSIQRLPADSPEGTVQAYLIALRDGDYAKATSFLLIPEPDPRLPPGYPVPYPPPYRPNTASPAWKANLGKTQITGDQATVEVMVDVFRGPSGPFDNPVNSMTIVFSLKQVSGKWLITQPLDAYWLY